MSFLRRRQTESLIPQSEDADRTYVARLAREEAADDWRNKPRHEKLRLARIELRRRRSERRGLLGASFWRQRETLLIVSLALAGLLALLVLLHHRAGRGGETWLESVEEVLGVL